VPDRDTLIRSTVSPAVFPLTDVQSVAVGAACAGAAAAAPATIAASAQKARIRRRVR
jgi:hypothetical protein